jgi:Protein of unknown function (DUF3828)
MLAVSACKSHTAVTPAQQKAVQSVAQQPVPAQVETDQERSCRVFVQGFYDWYINGHLKNDKGPPWHDVPKKKPQMLSEQLLRLLNREWAEEKRTHNIGAIDFDPFLNSQDPIETYVVQQVSVVDEKCDALVKGTSEVRPELKSRGSSWVFVNFHYSFFNEDGKTRFAPDDDLVRMLIAEEERESTEKKTRAKK